MTWVVCLVLWAAGTATPSVALPLSVSGRLLADCLALQPGPGPTVCRLVEEDRRILDEGIAEYTYTLQVGLGEHDRVVVHRVVAELLPGVPRTPPRSVFLLHGDIWGFRAAFLPSVTNSVLKRERSFAVYLARQGLDVWGMDLRWVHVPPHTTDFTFMRNWNLEMHAQDVRAGILLARTVRGVGLRGSGLAGAMPLLGWSRGATIGYVLLNAETQLPVDRRQVNGFIAVDMAYVLGPDAGSARADACLAYKYLAGLQMAGVYVDNSGQTLQDMGAYANAGPSLPSLLLPGFTHRQAALVAGAATHMMQGLPLFKWYHFTGGTFAGKTPTGVTWIEERFLFDTLELASPFQSIGEQVETLALWCGAPKLPYNDKLAQVRVPVFYLGAQGGMGRIGLSTLLQLGSPELSSYTVQRLPDEDRALDYGHADLFLAADASTEVWPRISSWLLVH